MLIILYLSVTLMRSSMISVGQLPLQTPAPSVKDMMAYSMLGSILLRYIGCLVMTLWHSHCPSRVGLRPQFQTGDNAQEAPPPSRTALVVVTFAGWSTQKGHGSQSEVLFTLRVWRTAVGSVARSFASDQRWNWNTLSERAAPGIL